nr:copia protein [Tanacetum cinerariifolium]
VKFTRTYIKNMSAAYYSSGRTMEWANKFKGDDLITEYNKIKSAVERSTTSQGVPADTGVSTDENVPADQCVPADQGVPADTSILAVTGVSAEATIPADQRVSADQGVPADASILDDTCVSAKAATTTIPVNAQLDEDEPAEELSSLRRSTRKKSVAKKRTTPPSSYIPFSTDDHDAAHRVHITFASDDSDDDDTPHPIITGVHLLDWQVVPSGLGTIHTLLCHGGIRKTFTTLREILHMVDRQTLIRLYGFVDALSKKQPLDGLALSLWGDLRIMLDTLEVDFSSLVWQEQHKWRMSLAVKSWKTCQGNSSTDLPAFTGAEVLVTDFGDSTLTSVHTLWDAMRIGQAGDNTDKQCSSYPSMLTSQEDLKTSYLEAVKRIFQYIKGTTHLRLWYSKRSDIETIVYADSDHAGDYVDCKSTSGVYTFMGRCLTSWFSKKQTAFAISTTEAEYVSVGKACQQAIWMKQALVDYGVRLDDIPITRVNKGAIDLSKILVQHSRTKHIEIHHHFLRDNVQKGNISIENISSKDNIADILTKPLKRETFNYLRLGLGMMKQID